MITHPSRAIRCGLVLVCLAAGLAADRTELKPEKHGQKPMFPVRTQLQLLNEPRPGGVGNVLVSLTSWAPGEEVEWQLTIPQRFTLVSGPTHWAGRLPKGETRTFEVQVKIPDGTEQEMFATARIVDRPIARSGATLTIDLGPPDGLKATRRVVDASGTSHIQYHGQVTPRGGGE